MRSRSHKIIIKVKNLWKSFGPVGKRVPVLRGINLNLYSGEFAIVFGPSGCGKSTLLHAILGLEEPDRGKIYLREKSLYHMSEDSRALWRRKKVGMVFQQSNWIKSMKVWENVGYPLMLEGYPEGRVFEKAMEELKRVGLENMAFQKPTELSGGEQQKAALARALITDPGIIICDEPTGNLDSKSGFELIGILKKLNEVQRKAILMVTHERNFLPYATRRIFMKDGKIVKDEHN
jgi:putative ABC transport system ATP-binding protein